VGTRGRRTGDDILSGTVRALAHCGDGARLPERNLTHHPWSPGPGSGSGPAGPRWVGITVGIDSGASHLHQVPMVDSGNQPIAKSYCQRRDSNPHGREPNGF